MAKSTAEPVTKKNTKNGLEISATGRIHTLEDLLEVAKVDMSVWQVDYFYVNKWDMPTKIGVQTMWQVKARLVPKLPDELTKEGILAELTELSPVVERFRRKKRTAPVRGSYMLEVSPFDLHLGMRAWAEETGVEYNPETATELMLQAVRELIERTRVYGIGSILFVVGNDFLHVDTKEGRTANNTPQDIAVGYQQMFRLGRGVLVEAIDMLKEVAPVQVVVIPGNHDEQTSLFLGAVLEAWYRNDANVHVDAEVRFRKYRQWGVSLLGFTHGKYEKLLELPALMAREQPQTWADTRHREWHLGHKHKLEADEVQGVRVRRLPSLSAKDSWHTRQGYGSLRAVEAYLWEADNGYAGHVSVNARELST